MTERQRLQRAQKLAVHCAAGCSPAVAWRKVKAGSTASDKNAAKLCERELERLERWLAENPGVPGAGTPALVPKTMGDGMQEPASSKQCIGVAERPCEAKISRRRKRCPACAAEQRRLNRRGYGLTYYRSHRETLNAKRNERRGRQHLREFIQKAAAEKREESARRAAMPRLIVDKRTGESYIFHPKTGQREYQNPSGGFGW